MGQTVRVPLHHTIVADGLLAEASEVDMIAIGVDL